MVKSLGVRHVKVFHQLKMIVFFIWKLTTYAFTFYKNIDSQANINKDAMSIKHIYILANDSYIFLFNLKSVSKFEDKCFASFFFSKLFCDPEIIMIAE